MENDAPKMVFHAVRKCSLGKTAAVVATGALAGVGLVAAAPVFGAVGVVTGVGALVGGLGGAAVGGGVAYASDDSEQQSQAATAARNQAQAEYSARLDAIAESFAKLKRMHDAQLKHDDVCLELYRVAIACLKQCNAAGDPDLVTEMRAYVFGAAHESLAWHIELELSLIDPPNLASALVRAHAVAPEADKLVDAIVQLIAVLADPDGTHGLQPSWAQLRAA